MVSLQYFNDYSKNQALGFRRDKDGENFVEIPQFKAGDEIIVAIRVVEGEKERIQNYRGVVIARRGEGFNQTFRVRKISNGVGVEKIFPLFSPMIQSITMVKEGHVRRAKLYYLRGMSERKIRQKLH